MICGFCVSFCIYEVEENVFFREKSQKCEQFSYEIFGGICLALNGPYVAEASLGRNSDSIFKVYQQNIQNIQSINNAIHISINKTVIIWNLFFERYGFPKLSDIFDFWKCICLFWCGVYYKLLFLMCVSDSVSFSVEIVCHFIENVKKCEKQSYDFFINKVYIY